MDISTGQGSRDENMRMQGIRVTIMLCALCIVVFVGLTSPVGADSAQEVATNVHVVEAGGSIQRAIDQAEAGDTILVRPGRYAESIILDKAGVTLRALKDHEAIVEGLISIEADGVTLAGMFIERRTEDEREVTISVRRGHADITIAGNIVEGGSEGGQLSRGIRLSSAGAVVRNNIVRNHTGNGIWVETGEHDVVITGNILASNRDGLNFQNSDDEIVVSITISQNHFLDNTAGGIAIGRWAWSDDFIITGNRIDPGDAEGYYVSDWRYEYGAFVDGNTPEPSRKVLVEDNSMVGASAGKAHWFWTGTGWQLRPGELIVRDGDEIQAALDGAEPGGRIVIEPGTYEHTLRVDRRMVIHIDDESTDGE